MFYVAILLTTEALKWEKCGRWPKSLYCCTLGSAISSHTYRYMK